MQIYLTKPTPNLCEYRDLSLFLSLSLSLSFSLSLSLFLSLSFSLSQEPTVSESDTKQPGPMTTEAVGKFTFKDGKKTGLGVFYRTRDWNEHLLGFYEYHKPIVCPTRLSPVMTGLDLQRELEDCKTSAFPPAWF